MTQHISYDNKSAPPKPPHVSHSLSSCYQTEQQLFDTLPGPPLSDLNPFIVSDMVNAVWSLFSISVGGCL